MNNKNGPIQPTNTCAWECRTFTIKHFYSMVLLLLLPHHISTLVHQHLHVTISLSLILPSFISFPGKAKPPSLQVVNTHRDHRQSDGPLAVRAARPGRSQVVRLAVEFITGDILTRRDQRSHSNCEKNIPRGRYVFVF